MSHQCRGQAVIINYTWNNTGAERWGSEKDVDALKKLFQQLGFNVTVQQDLDREVKSNDWNNHMEY